MIFNNPSRFFPLLGRARRCYDWPRRTGGNTDPGGTMAHKAAKKVWFITGAGRGMGVDFAKAALAAGHTVVATGRDPDALAKAVGESDDLLVVKLDVTRSEEHTSELQSLAYLVCRLLLEKKKKIKYNVGVLD